MRRKSKKRAAADRRAKPARDAVLERADGLCQIRRALADALREAGDGFKVLSFDAAAVVERALRLCAIQAQGVHERRKQSAGGSRTNPANLMAACNRCNVDFVEGYPELAHQLGLVVRPGDPEWEELGAEPTKIVRRGRV